MTKYVQYLNVGLGIFNNIREVNEWNTDVAIEEALSLENEEQDIRIVGFRFFEKDENTQQIVSESGIYYLQGEIVSNPSDDSQIVSYFENRISAKTIDGMYNRADSSILGVYFHMDCLVEIHTPFKFKIALTFCFNAKSPAYLLL